MKLHPTTKILAVITLIAGTLCLCSGSPTASIGEMKPIGEIVSFQWIGWPYPLVYGDIPSTGGSAADTMNRFLFDEGRAYFAIGVWAAFLVLFTVGVAGLAEVAARILARTRLRRTT